MYFPKIKFPNIKNILIIALLISLIFFVFKNGCKTNIGSSLIDKDKTELNTKINVLQKKNDSLSLVSNNLQNQYNTLQKNYVKDSLVQDSLGNELNISYNKAEKSEQKANYYLGKFNDINNSITKFQNTKDTKKGDSLLKSLSKNINN